MTELYQVGALVELIQRAAKAKGNAKLLMIMEGNKMISELDGIQLNDLLDETKKMNETEFNSLIAMGIPGQIYSQVLRQCSTNLKKAALDERE